jgi:hypothetical protein
MDGEEMIPANITPEEKRRAWENLKAFMEVARRTGLSKYTSNNSGVVAPTAAPIFSEAQYE